MAADAIFFLGGGGSGGGRTEHILGEWCQAG